MVEGSIPHLCSDRSLPLLLSRAGHVVGIQQPLFEVLAACQVWTRCISGFCPHLCSSCLFCAQAGATVRLRESSLGREDSRRPVRHSERLGPPGFSSFIRGLLVGWPSPGWPRLRALG